MRAALRAVDRQPPRLARDDRHRPVRRRRRDYRRARGRVDVCEVHDYERAAALPGDPWNGLAARSRSATRRQADVRRRVGIVADVDANGGSSGTTPRRPCSGAPFISAKLDAAFDNGVDGYLLWEKIPDASGPPSSSTTALRDRARDPLKAMTLAKAGQFGGNLRLRLRLRRRLRRHRRPRWCELRGRHDAVLEGRVGFDRAGDSTA